MKLTATFILATAVFLHADVKVSIGEISDRRTTGENFNGMEVKLKVSGAELSDCKGLRISLKDSTDDAGKPIKINDRFGSKHDSFQKPEKPFAGFDKPKEGEFEVKLDFENPARSAKTMKLIGSLDVLIPSRDPASVVTASPTKDSGRPLVNPVIKAAGVEITFDAPKSDSLGYSIKDPNKKVASVEFCSADGKPLETSGWSSSGFLGTQSKSVNLKDSPPAGVIAKIYLLTEKSVVSVPLKLDAIALP